LTSEGMRKKEGVHGGHARSGTQKEHFSSGWRTGSRKKFTTALAAQKKGPGCLEAKKPGDCPKKPREGAALVSQQKRSAVLRKKGVSMQKQNEEGYPVGERGEGGSRLFDSILGGKGMDLQ